MEETGSMGLHQGVVGHECVQLLWSHQVDSTISIRPEEVCPLVASLFELSRYTVGFDDGVPIVSDCVVNLVFSQAAGGAVGTL